jgi:hypothetical protein
MESLSGGNRSGNRASCYIFTAGAFEPGAGGCRGAAAPPPFYPVFVVYVMLEL